MVCVIVILVHALAGSSLALELSPLWGTWHMVDVGERVIPVSYTSWVAAGRSEVTLNSGKSFHQLLRFQRGFGDLFRSLGTREEVSLG